MLYLVKINPKLFLPACAPEKSRVVKVPPEVPVGRFSLENQRAAGDGTGKPRGTCIGRARRGGGGWSFQRVWGGTGCLWESSFNYRGGNLSGRGTFGRDFMGVAGHD